MKKTILGYILILILCAIGFLIAIYKENALETNHEITLGSIYDVELSSKNPDIFVKFKYNVAGKILDDNSSIPCNHSNCLPFLYSLLKGKILPVVYQKNSPTNCLMLFSQKEYSKYKIKLTPEQQKIISVIDSLVARN